MKIIAMLSILISLALLSGCQYSATDNDTNDLTGKIVLEDDDFVFIDEEAPIVEEGDGDIVAIDEEDSSDDVLDSDTELEVEDDEIEIEERDVAYTLSATEGELVKLELGAVDPDGDELQYTFTEPLNAQGRWQTVIGDEGKYLVTVTATDGKLSTSEDILLVINRANRAPVIECPETLTVSEGETLLVDCNIYDEEGDNILISYEGWTTSSSKTTSFDDAGEYTVLVRSSDGKQESTKTINVVVENVNRVPVIQPISDITVMETNDVSVSPQVSDPDGDEVRISYTSPLGPDGAWATTDGDAGVYEVNVAASDGSATATTSFEITVTQINTAPVLKTIEDITVDEGETIVIPVNAYDPEGDELVVRYAGFMEGQEYATTYDDAGVYDQTVTVSDGVLETTQSFMITVVNKNRAPQFVFG